MLIIKEYNEKNIPYHLLLEADPSKSNVDNYLSKGLLFGAYSDNLLIGVFILIRNSAENFEIANLSILQSYQNKSYGKKLIEAAENQALLLGGKYMEIGTAYPLVPYYEKQGYKQTSIIKDFFISNYDKPVYENGMLLKDMIRLTKKL